MRPNYPQYARPERKVQAIHESAPQRRACDGGELGKNGSAVAGLFAREGGRPIKIDNAKLGRKTAVISYCTSAVEFMLGGIQASGS
jgi:hypothetical protein